MFVFIRCRIFSVLHHQYCESAPFQPSYMVLTLFRYSEITASATEMFSSYKMPRFIQGVVSHISSFSKIQYLEIIEDFQHVGGYDNTECSNNHLSENSPVLRAMFRFKTLNTGTNKLRVSYLIQLLQC
jgi:hypothetical protein